MAGTSPAMTASDLISHHPRELVSVVSVHAVKIACATSLRVTARGSFGRLRDRASSSLNQEIELGYRSISVPVPHLSGAAIGSLHIGGRVETCSFTIDFPGVFLFCLRAPKSYRPSFPRPDGNVGAATLCIAV